MNTFSKLMKNAQLSQIKKLKSGTKVISMNRMSPINCLGSIFVKINLIKISFYKSWITIYKEFSSRNNKNYSKNCTERNSNKTIRI